MEILIGYVCSHGAKALGIKKHVFHRTNIV